jgi:hypothetical protein
MLGSFYNLGEVKMLPQGHAYTKYEQTALKLRVEVATSVA